jgi:hypothetical protein
MKSKMTKNSKKSSLMDSPARRAVIADMSARAKTIKIDLALRPTK